MNKRLPLANTLELRDIAEEKDAIISNGFVEIEDAQIFYIYKRPGIIQKLVGAGIAHGIFIYEGNLYSWDASDLNTIPTITLVSSL